MSSGRTKILGLLAIIGFLIGAVAYFLLDMFVLNETSTLLPAMISTVMTPWFISGLIGSAIILVAVTVFVQISRN